MVVYFFTFAVLLFQVGSEAHLSFSSGVFHSSEEYQKIEEELKVFIYPDGDPETYFHTPMKLSRRYASEGYFFTDDPLQAHIFFLPVSCYKMRNRDLTQERMILEVQKYVEHLKFKYPYWNKTLGTDLFFVTCHDISVKSTKGVPRLMKNLIRVVCSSSYDNNDYNPHKDVILPQIQLYFFHLPVGNDIKNRNTITSWGDSDGRLEYEPAFMWDKDTCGPIGSNRIANSIHYGRVQVNFDFWKLAVTWPKGYCKYTRCHSSLPQKFIIHGLWPSTYIDPQPFKCTQVPFTNQMVKTLYPRLKSDWPSLTMNDYKFWGHEWSKHGTCSTMDGHDYFELGLDIYSWNDLGAILIDAGISPGASYGFYDITNAIQTRIGVEPELKCSSNDLVEIRLCLNTATPPEYMHCSGWTDCPYVVHFP